MSFLDRIRDCNNHDPAGFVPFVVDGRRMGSVRPEFAARLCGYPGVFAVTTEMVSLESRLDSYEARSAAVDGALRDLAAKGAIKGWRDEPYPVTTAFAAPPLLRMERAAVPHFGVRAFGVHMNGYVRRPDGIHLWVPRRAYDKPNCPGMLDNTVAGGQPLGIGVKENLIKECAEEAGIPRAIAERAIAVGAISYAYESRDGLKPDVQFCFDLELPEDFTPVNQDGEVHEFMLWPIRKAARVVSATRQFKFNCNLVIIDFLIRHGLIPPEHPDYVDIVAGLRR